MFTNVVERDVDTKKYLSNFRSDRYLFRIYNFKKPEGHAANDILRGDEGIPYAIHCNCGKYHTVVIDEAYLYHNPNSKRTIVLWDPKFEITASKKTDVLKKIKMMWIDQEVD